MRENDLDAWRIYIDVNQKAFQNIWSKEEFNILLEINEIIENTPIGYLNRLAKLSKKFTN